MASIKAHSGFNVEDDCKALKKAMKGLGTDEDAIIAVLANRDAAQRAAIAQNYKKLYGDDLFKELKSELKGNLETAVIALLTPAAARDAQWLRDAIKGAGTDEKVLFEIICSRSNAEIKAIKESYHAQFNRDLESDVAGDTSGDVRRLLVALLQGERDESTTVDAAKAAKEANELYQAGQGRLGTEESEFVRILGSRSRAQLRATFEQYGKLTGYDIEKAIEKELSGDLERAFLNTVQCLKSAPTFFATVLYKAMKGAGTDDTTLIRVVTSRADVDLANVAKEFMSMYGKSLAKWIESETSGDYRKLLLAILH